jgi:hypothetical protein
MILLGASAHGKKTKVASSLDLPNQASLVLGRSPGDSPGQDLSLLGYEPPENIRPLIVHNQVVGLDLVDFPSEIGPAATAASPTSETTSAAAAVVPAVTTAIVAAAIVPTAAATSVVASGTVSGALRSLLRASVFV